jgi:hypothetical protein
VARWSNADKEKATGFPSVLFRTMSVSLGREVCWFFFSDALDMELALRQSSGGGVSVCLDPAHLPGPWTCNMRVLMYCSICSLPSRDCQQIGHVRYYGWIVDRSSSMLSPREVAVRWHVRAFRVMVGVGLCNRWNIESASRWSTTIKNLTCRFGHGKNGPIRYLEQYSMDDTQEERTPSNRRPHPNNQRITSLLTNAYKHQKGRQAMFKRQVTSRLLSTRL